MPLVQIGILGTVFRSLWPQAAGQLEMSGFVAFLLSFTLIDYIYYWNHRLLHSRNLWPVHRVHHSVESMDLWASSRNSIWTPLLLIYIWSQGILIFLLKDPSWFLWGVATSNALDLWRHSGMQTPPLIRRSLGAIFVLPEDHEWHHSRDQHGINFGANLNSWDRLHGSFYRPQERAAVLGVSVDGSLADRLLRPWKLQ